MSKVFGIGLPKTGTQSLAKALHRLGIPTLHNPKDFWGLLHKGIVDFPGEWQGLVHLGMRQFRQLDRAYPGSKFILTVRDKGAWLASCERQIKERFVYDAVQERVRIDVFGSTDYHPELFSDAYDAHCWVVLEWFKTLESERWLVWDLCATPEWSIVCDFLEKPLPDQPFPFENNVKDIIKAKNEALRRNRGF